MSTVTSFRHRAVVAAALGLLGACAKKDAGSSAPVEAFSKATFVPTMVVLNEVGDPIVGAKVTVGTTAVMTDAKGLAKLPELARDKSAVATATMDGFAPLTKTVSFESSYTPLRVSMTHYRSVPVNADIGGHVDLGASGVDLPGRALLREDGSPYTGRVNVQAVPLFDPGAGPTNAGLGEGFAKGPRGPIPVAFVGGVDLALSTADGKKLGFAAGQRPVVEVLLPAGMSRKVGDTLPLWDLDRTTGLWNEVSRCKVTEAAHPLGDRTLACVGRVEHFSAVAVGVPLPQAACFTVSLKLTGPLPAGTKLLSWAVVPMTGAAVPGGPWSGPWGPPSPGPWGGPWMWPSPYGMALAAPLPAAPLGAYTLMVSAPPFAVPDRVYFDLYVYWDTGTTEPYLLAPLAGTIDVPARWMVDWTAPAAIPVSARFDPSMPWQCSQVEIPVDPLKGIAGDPADRDLDGDGYPRSADCDDGDRRIYPGAPAVVCDGKDHDCDGKPDSETLLPAGLSAAEKDRVWNASCAATRALCGGMLGPEVPGNGRDEDCDGVVSDADGDGYLALGDPALQPGAEVDCNDSDPNVHPGFLAVEMPGNLVDEDCDGIASDMDGDHYPSAVEVALGRQGLSSGPVDCNDLDPDVHPGAVSDKPVLADYYVNGKRKAEFCELFDEKGYPSAKLRDLLLTADRNCNGLAEDLDGDGLVAASAGLASAMPPYDIDDFDPRVQRLGQPAGPNELECGTPPSSMNAGGGDHLACPRLFGREQWCLKAATGDFICVPDDWTTFNMPPEPYVFGGISGPCAPGVLPNCPAGSLCAGPLTYAPWYKDTLRSIMASYDVARSGFTGFCTPICSK